MKRLAQAVAVSIVVAMPAIALAQASAPAPLPNMTAKEANADAIWKLRAGLNVAALQCQFSPFLQTVPTYNALLRQHSDEFADAFKTMTGYFSRLQKGRAGERAFDTYATRTNQSWSTFDGQVSFCEEAAQVGKRALAVPKGKLGEFAGVEMEKFRTSLARHQTEPLRTLKLEWVNVPDVNNCGKKRC